MANTQIFLCITAIVIIYRWKGELNGSQAPSSACERLRRSQAERAPTFDKPRDLQGLSVFVMLTG